MLLLNERSNIKDKRQQKQKEVFLIASVRNHRIWNRSG